MPMDFITSITVDLWSYQKGLLISIKCSIKSALYISSKQDLKLLNSSCGKSVINPTVSYNIAYCPEGNINFFYEDWRVMNNMSLLSTISFFIKQFINCDLPLLVYPIKAIWAIFLLSLSYYRFSLRNSLFFISYSNSFLILDYLSVIILRSNSN
jgi:hypothetical protein